MRVRFFILGFLTLIGGVVVFGQSAPAAQIEPMSLGDQDEVAQETANILALALVSQDRRRRPTTRPSPQPPGQYQPGTPRPRPVYRPYRPVRPIIIPVPVEPYYRGRYSSRGQCRSWERSCDRGYRYACRRYADSCQRTTYRNTSCRRRFNDCEDGDASACRTYRRQCLD